MNEIMWSKKIISFIMAMIIVITMSFSVPGLKMEAAGTEVTYAVTGGNIIFDTSMGTIINCDQSVTEAVIPTEIEGVSVTGIGKSAFSNCYDLVSIEIPVSVMNIEEYAFSDCYNLISIEIPASVTSIGKEVFEDCNSLKNINVDKNNINYSSVDGVLLNKNQTTLICYPAGKRETTYIIPTGVTNIGNSAFWSCFNLKSIEIPEGVTSIEDYAFFNCTDLSSIEISASVTSMGNVFAACSSLNRINVDKKNTNYSSVDGVLFDKNQTTLIRYPSGKTETTYIIPTGVTNIEEYAFSDCYNLVSVEIPLGVNNIEDCAFSNCGNLSSVNIPISVTSIENAVFDYCNKLTDVYYGGSKEDWNNITIGSYNENLQNATIHYNSIDSGDIGSSIPQAKKYTDIKGVLSQSGSGTGNVYLTYDETKLSEASNVYNHQLARFSIGLSTMAYSTDSKMRDILEKLDYKNIQSVKDEQPLEYATSPYWICHKKVMLDGKETELLLVVIRGTYHEEWLDNFDSGTQDTHMGFQRAANFVINGMYNYVKNSQNKVDQNADLKILVTGHSRGAATANLVGKTLDGGNTLYNMDFNTNDVFVYTYATPNVTRSSERNSSKYNNIFNIVNPEDFVTKVLPSDWGYGRYGITYVLPSKTTDIKESGNYVNYSSYLTKLRDHFMTLRPDDTKGYIPYSNGMSSVSSYVKDVTNTIQNINEYYMRSLCTYVSGLLQEPNSSLHNLYKYTLGGLCSNNDKYEQLAFVNIGKIFSGAFGWLGIRTGAFFIVNHKIDPKFDCAHFSETYLSAMECLSKEQLINVKRKTLKGIVNCPVDVTITDEDGNVVGQIIDNKVNESIENGITMSVEGDSKIFYLPESIPFSVTLTGNDNGTMDYSLCQYNPDTGTGGRIYYQDIKIESGSSMTQKIQSDDTFDTVILKTEEGNEITPTQIIDEAETGKLSVDVTVEGIGLANSLANLTQGDYVTLSATTDENNEFLGWYDQSNNLLTTEKEYSFSIKKSMNFTAKFTNNFVNLTNIQFEHNNIQMDIDEYVLNTASVVPTNATDQNIYYSSSDESIVFVDEIGMLHALKDGTAVITARNNDNTFSAQCKVTVGKEENGTESTPSTSVPSTENDSNTGTVNQQKSPVVQNPYNQVVKGIRLLGISNKIAAGKRIKLTANAFPVNALNQHLIWSSSNPKVAAVNQSGVVTVKKKTGGKSVIITARATDGSGATATFRIKSMKGVVKKVTIAGAKKRTVKAGKKLKLKAKVTATKGANKKLIWTSSNTNYATVSASGKVKTKKMGKGKKVKITAMATDGSNKKMVVTIKMK